MSKSSAAGRSKNSASSSSSNNNDNQAPYQPFHRPPILYKNGSTTLDATKAWPYAIVIHETEKGNDGKKGDTVAKHISPRSHTCCLLSTDVVRGCDMTTTLFIKVVGLVYFNQLVCKS